MKAPAPKPPKRLQDAGHLVTDGKIVARYNAIVYIHKEKAWKPVYDKYASIIFSDLGAADLNERYSISAFVGQEKMLHYIITMSTKVKIKDSFVRVQNEKMIVGARFKTNEEAEKYHQQVLGILSEICPYAQVVKQPKNAITSIDSMHGKLAHRETTPDNSSSKQENAKLKPRNRASVPAILTDANINTETETSKKDSVCITSIDSMHGKPACRETTPDISSSKQENAKLKSRNRASVPAVPTDAIINTEAEMSSKDSVRITSIDNIPKKPARRETAPEISISQQECAKHKPRNRASVPAIPTDAITNTVAETSKKDSVRIKGDFSIPTITEKKELETSDIEHPIWRAFLDRANLHSEELSNPRILSVVKNFVKEQGGELFLRQVNDQKLSARIADDLSNLAGQIHAISEEAYPKANVESQDNVILVKQEIQCTAQPGDSSTLGRRSTKNKRRAPEPPMRRSKSVEDVLDVLDHGSMRSKSLANVLGNDTLYSEIGPFLKNPSKTGDVSMVKTLSPAGKRKAPDVPAGQSPVISLHRKNITSEDKPLPCFVPPPPPVEPPPQEASGSPVDPLSPEMTGSPLIPLLPEVIDDTGDTFEKEVTSEMDLAEELDTVICTGKNDITEKSCGNIVSAEECEAPGETKGDKDTSTTIINLPCVAGALTDNGNKAADVVSVQGENTLEMQQQMQQQLLVLQEQVLQQQQLMLAAGIIDGKCESVKPQDKPPTVCTSSESSGTEELIKMKAEVNHIPDDQVKLNTAVIPPSSSPTSVKTKTEIKLIPDDQVKLNTAVIPPSSPSSSVKTKTDVNHIPGDQVKLNTTVLPPTAVKTKTEVKHIPDIRVNLNTAVIPPSSSTSVKTKTEVNHIPDDQVKLSHANSYEIETNVSSNYDLSVSVGSELTGSKSSQPTNELDTLELELDLEELPPPPADFLDTTIDSPAMLPTDNENVEPILSDSNDSTAKEIVENIKLCVNDVDSSAPNMHKEEHKEEAAKHVPADCKTIDTKGDSVNSHNSVAESSDRPPLVQPGLPKKPTSGLYAKLKAKTAAKNKARVDSLVSNTKIKNECNNNSVIKPIDVCNTTEESVVNNKTDAQDAESHSEVVLTDDGSCRTISSTEMKNVPVTNHEIHQTTVQKTNFDEVQGSQHQTSANSQDTNVVGTGSTCLNKDEGLNSSDSMHMSVDQNITTDERLTITTTTQLTVLDTNKETLHISVDEDHSVLSECSTPVDPVNQHITTSQLPSEDITDKSTTTELRHATPLLEASSVEKEGDSTVLQCGSAGDPCLETNKTKVKPIVKPKPKPKPKPVINKNNMAESKQSTTYMRTVSEQPGGCQTTHLKSVGSLNIQFARDTPTVNNVFSKKEPPKTLPKTKPLYRNASVDQTGTGKGNSMSNQAGRTSLGSINSIDADLRSTTLRNEDPC